MNSIKSKTFVPAPILPLLPAVVEKKDEPKKPVEGWDKPFDLNWPWNSTQPNVEKKGEQQPQPSSTEEKVGESPQVTPSPPGTVEEKPTPVESSKAKVMPALVPDDEPPTPKPEESSATEKPTDEKPPTEEDKQLEYLHSSSEHLHPCKADDLLPLLSDGKLLYVISRLPEEKKPEAEKPAEVAPAQSDEKGGEAIQPFGFSTEPITGGEGATNPAAIVDVLSAAAPQAATSSASPQSNRVFIGGVPYSWNEERIRELLLPFGPIRAFQYEVDEEGRFKGYAFFEYRDPSVTGK